MENTFKRNIQKLLIFMLTAAVIPLFWLLGPLLPSPLSGIVLLLLTVGWILFCFFRPALGQCGNIGLPWQEVVPATHLHCMVPFLHAIMLWMGNLDDFDFYINIR